MLPANGLLRCIFGLHHSLFTETDSSSERSRSATMPHRAYRTPLLILVFDSASAEERCCLNVAIASNPSGMRVSGQTPRSRTCSNTTPQTDMLAPKMRHKSRRKWALLYLSPVQPIGLCLASEKVSPLRSCMKLPAYLCS